MTVLDELHQMSKYTHLVFIEFLDMVARLAIISIKTEGSIEQKTHILLGIIYDKMHSNKQLKKKELQLFPP